MAAYGIVLKPIPGTGYSLGEPAIFSDKQEEKFAEYLTEGSYLRTVTKAEYEKLIEDKEAAEAKKVTDGETKKAPAGEKR